MLLLPADFSEKKVALSQIYLDPTNPRFATEKDVNIPDEKIMGSATQASCLMKMQKYDLEELKESIKEVGFVPVDRIVVRPIATKTTEEAFVVLEGNRRVAALKILVKENELGETTIDPEVLKTITNFEVFVYTGDNPDMAWIIQGIRHISGVKSWPPYQQALTLYKMTHHGADIKDAARTLGLALANAVKLIRAMHGFQYARNESEYTDKLNPEHFAYFNEVIFRQTYLSQTYLKWNEKAKKFDKLDNLNKLLSWIFPEQGKQAKITQAMQLRDDIVPAMIRYPKIFERWENDENMTIKEINIEVGKTEQKQAGANVNKWLDIINAFNNDLSDLPTIKIKDRKEDFITKLTKTQKLCEGHIDLLSKI